MARVTLAMASSSTTRCGLLLSSAIALGTALGSAPPRTSRLPPAPRVARLLESAARAGSSFMGDGALGFDLADVAPVVFVLALGAATGLDVCVAWFGRFCEV